MLAIIIPFFKGEYFDQTLASISKQTNKNFVVYIGNDNSPFDCKDIVAKYECAFSIRYTKFDNNLGQRSLAGHWQRCIGLIANEEWVMFLGDDDMLSPKCVEEFYEAVDKVNLYKINVARYSSIIIDENGNETSKQFLFPFLEGTTLSLIRKFQRKSRASLSEHIFRRSEFEKNGFADMPVAWHSDDIAIMETTHFGKIYTMNKACVFVRYSASSISGQGGNVWRKNLATLKFLRFLIANHAQNFSKWERTYIIWFYFKKLKHFHKLSPGNIFQIVGMLVRNLFNIQVLISKPVKIRRAGQ